MNNYKNKIKKSGAFPAQLLLATIKYIDKVHYAINNAQFR